MPPITEILFGDQDGRRVASGQTIANASPPSALIAPITAADIAAGKRAAEIAFGTTVGDLTLHATNDFLNQRAGYVSSGGNYPGSTLTPGSYNGEDVTEISATLLVVDPETIISFGNAALARDFFTSVTVGGTTLLSADAGYGAGIWTWVTRLYVGAGDYTVIFS